MNGYYTVSRCTNRGVCREKVGGGGCIEGVKDPL